MRAVLLGAAMAGCAGLTGTLAPPAAAVREAAPQLWPFDVAELEDGVAWLSLPESDPRIRPRSPEEEEPTIVVNTPRRLPWNPLRYCHLGSSRAVAAFKILRRARPLPKALVDTMPQFGGGANGLLFWTRARPLTELVVEIGYPLTDAAHRGRIAILVQRTTYASISAADGAALDKLFADLVCDP